VNTFAPDGYFREPIGPHSTHRGAGELRSFFVYDDVEPPVEHA
jgi:hypothetical protein